MFKLCRNDLHVRYLDIVEQGQERKEEEFDLYNIIKESKDLKYEMEVLKIKMDVVEDAIFNEINSNELINLEE